jgi:site-specific DNA recombinase
MRAVIYARYSSDLQSESSIDDQVRLCRERVEQENGTVVDIYADYAISGGSLHNRPSMQALLKQAKSGRFDYVIAEALDRVSRDQEDIAAIYKRLRHADIRLLTLAEGEISELHVGLKGTMNALFLKDLALKIRRGHRGRVEAGKIPGGNSYGYRIIRQLRPDGSVSTGERQIDPSQAAIVRRIFEEYGNGMAPRQIAARLNREATPGPRGGQWNASTINGNRRRRNGILNNELYTGRITYNRQRFVKDPETGKRIARPNPEHEWVIKEVPGLRIIEDELWERVHALKQRYSSRWGNKRQNKKRLLSGLLKCGRCGGGMTTSRGDRYYCSARREKSTCNADRGIVARELEDRVLNGLRDILLRGADRRVRG